MKFYDKNKKQFVEFGDSFIEQYAKAYYYPENGKIDQPLIKRLSRCSQYSEREIDSLSESGIKNEEDVIHILAWKIGKIAHKTCSEKKPFSFLRHRPLGSMCFLTAAVERIGKAADKPKFDACHQKPVSILRMVRAKGEAG